MTISEFKVRFVSYYRYVEHKAKLEQEISELYYHLSGVKAVRYDKLPSSFNPHLSEVTRLETIDKIESKIKEYNSINTEHEYMKHIVNKLTSDEMSILVRLLINKESYDYVGRDYGYTASGMWRYVESIIGSVL